VRWELSSNYLDPFGRCELQIPKLIGESDLKEIKISYEWVGLPVFVKKIYEPEFLLVVAYEVDPHGLVKFSSIKEIT
jgi:hypothetical protein